MISQEHTPTTRPVAERVQHIKFSGTYNDAGVEADATALVGKQAYPIRCNVAIAVADEWCRSRPKLAVPYDKPDLSGDFRYWGETGSG